MKFLKLTDMTDNRLISINICQIIYVQKAVSEGTVIATNYMGLIYVKEAPEEILKLIEFKEEK